MQLLHGESNADAGRSLCPGAGAQRRGGTRGSPGRHGARRDPLTVVPGLGCVGRAELAHAVNTIGIQRRSFLWLQVSVFTPNSPGKLPRFALP